MMSVPWGRERVSNNAEKRGQGLPRGGRGFNYKWTSFSVWSQEERREHSFLQNFAITFFLYINKEKLQYK